MSTPKHSDRITITGGNDCTNYPWWAIVDPRQMMKASVHDAAAMITGPFFSRAAAEQVLQARRYHFGKHAVVFCFSGHMSPDYRERVDAGKVAP
jgi:hypothetical protein